jgi:EAL domain-containing protein (putative c-di-GMP-specific phosphodiesterase class I)
LSAARIAVNLSVLQFRQPNFAAPVRDILEKSGLIHNAGTLELELTESLLVKDVDGTVALLNELHGIGVRLSIDDFGTGYSCLSYLKHLPIDKLKIDQSFVRNLPADGEDAAIVNAIILGHASA